MKRQILVVGAGAAGLMAACAAADSGAQVTVLERNEKAGKKLFITGKGRGNYSNACDTQEFFRNVVRNPKFLYSAVYGFDSAAMTSFLENNGCPTKVERGQRCFPASDHAYDLTDALVRHLRGRGGRIRLHCGVKRILTEPDFACAEGRRAEVYGQEPWSAGIKCGSSDGTAPADENCSTPAKTERTVSEDGATGRRVTGVELDDGRRLSADAVIIATGGLSYPSTGSTGDGLRFARELGLNVSDPQPSLVPLVTEEEWPGQLQGLSLRNVAVKVEELPEAAEENVFKTADPAKDAAEGKEAAEGKKLPAENNSAERNNSAKGKRRKSAHKPVYEGFGEMLFTHFGVSGPLILSASCHTDFAQHPEGYLLHLDLKPALTREELTARLQREIETAHGKELRTLLRALLPQRLAETTAVLFEERTGWETDVPVRALGEKRIRTLAELMKDLTIHLIGTRGFSEAIVTRGGVSVKEINPSTMETRKIRGLYWAGEVIDVDAYTGGFNLQIAWSTGHLAGESAGRNAAL